MQFSNSLKLSLLSLITLSQARIIGISAPSTVAPGVPFTISVLTQNYIQTVYDVAIGFGISAGAGYPGTLGNVLATEYLGPDKSNVITPLNFTVSVSESFAKGEATIAASLMSLYGASSAPTLGEWNVTVTVGDATSEEYISSA